MLLTSFPSCKLVQMQLNSHASLQLEIYTVFGFLFHFFMHTFTRSNTANIVAAAAAAAVRLILSETFNLCSSINQRSVLFGGHEIDCTRFMNIWIYLPLSILCRKKATRIQHSIIHLKRDVNSLYQIFFCSLPLCWLVCAYKFQLNFVRIRCVIDSKVINKWNVALQKFPRWNLLSFIVLAVRAFIHSHWCACASQLFKISELISISKIYYNHFFACTETDTDEWGTKRNRKEYISPYCEKSECWKINKIEVQGFTLLCISLVRSRHPHPVWDPFQ